MMNLAGGRIPKPKLWRCRSNLKGPAETVARQLPMRTRSGPRLKYTLRKSGDRPLGPREHAEAVQILECANRGERFEGPLLATFAAQWIPLGELFRARRRRSPATRPSLSRCAGPAAALAQATSAKGSGF